ncbi:DUF2125 domain-containing protein [Methylobacterium marchantiae]|uniref:DUF2125 domain-containing protein n=1 Tax=Methylobacterium marchantiae TaxID=600331 RepID=A0ABW3WUW9_9HYPH|nr:hypothetical protein AIGOOFII_0476 [Methylobacterium marchantiae]
MAQGPDLTARKRPSRTGLFLPYILLLAVVLLWSAGWFWIRGKAESEMDAWLAREASAGRNWTCADRSITGYPFRIELRCASLAFSRADSRFTLGPLTAVVQVYQPRQGILQATGPFHVEQDGLVADATWTALEASFHGASDGFVRASLVVDAPKVSVKNAGPQPIDVAAKHLEFHARPTPARFATDGAVDTSLRLTQAAVPLLDPLLGNTTPVDMALDATVNQAAVFRTGQVARELETWRQAGGSLEIALLSLVKGDSRLQAQGKIALDDEHRSTGQIDIRAAGVEALVGQIMGQRFGAEKGALIGGLVGKLLGGGSRRQEAETGTAPVSGDASLKAMPPLRLAEGRLMLGPFPIPNVQVPPLY